MYLSFAPVFPARLAALALPCQVISCTIVKPRCKGASTIDRKSSIDAFGIGSLVAFNFLLALNQVAIKVTNGGLQPVFFAGLRSAGAIVCIGLWIFIRKKGFRVPKHLWPHTILIGMVFGLEFLFLFISLDLTSVSRASVIFYSMPVWLTLAGHFLLPGERLTVLKLVGLICAFCGVAWALFDRSGASFNGSLLGDLFALAASFCWASIALIARGTRFREVRPELQMFYQVVISAGLLLLIAPLFGPLLRDFQAVHLALLTFQIVVIISAGFVFWLWLLTIYPTSSVASFSFLAPVLGVALGWALLGEEISLSILGALALVAIGLVLINRPAQVPQKV